jgi:hypothetical protein
MPDGRTGRELNTSPRASHRSGRHQRKAPRPGTRRSKRHVRWLYAEFLMIGLVSAPSTNPGGRDQSLVRRSQTRHHDVRHWITSFPIVAPDPADGTALSRCQRDSSSRAVSAERLPGIIAVHSHGWRIEGALSHWLSCRWMPQGGRRTIAWNAQAEAAEGHSRQGSARSGRLTNS